MPSKDESPKRQPYDIGAVDADGNRQRAPVFQAVIKVLEGVPPASERSEKRSDEIEQLAFTICLAAGFAGMNDQPNAHQHPGGTDGDLKELQKAHDLLFGLWEHFSEMHLGSWGTLEKHDQRGLRDFQKEIARWSDRATEAWSELNETKHLPPPHTGQPKFVKAAIRPAALQAYERLAGLPAAMKDWKAGPVVDYFEALFVALGVPPEGAASQASKAIAERKATLGKAPL